MNVSSTHSFFRAVLFVSLLASLPLKATDFQISDRNLLREIKEADSYIATILRRHEAEFPGAMDYPYLNFYTPLRRISHIQQGLLTELLEMPRFRHALKTREPLISLNATVTSPIEFEDDSRSTRSWYSIHRKLVSTLEDAKELANVTTVEKLLHSMRTRVFEARKKSRHAWQESEIQELIQTWVIAESIYRREKEISIKNLISTIEDADHGLLDYLQDPHNYIPIVNAYPSTSPRSQSIKRGLVALMPVLHDELLFHQGFQPKVQTRISVGTSLKIREVHPEIAIFRGYVGNDCATSFSPGFVLNPYDRYFYVFDEKGLRLGYVGISLVEYEKSPAVFIHTIQGINFTRGHVHLVMRAFTQIALEVYKAPATFLSSDDSINANVNFSDIREQMTATVAGIKEVPVTWIDHEFRKKIVEWDSTLTYDNPERNSHGRELNFPSQALKVEVTTLPFSADFLPRMPQKRKEDRSCHRSLADDDDSPRKEWFL